MFPLFTDIRNDVTAAVSGYGDIPVSGAQHNIVVPDSKARKQGQRYLGC